MRAKVIGAAVALGASLALSVAAPARAAGQCGLPASAPLWIDFAEPEAPFPNMETLFRQRGLIIATSKPDYAASLRQSGVHTVYWDMHLRRRVGTPTNPADPATIVDRANRLFDFAAATSGCSTPLIALNELNGAHVPTPWTEWNAEYRANVLTFVRTLAARGARPFLLVPRRPATQGAAAAWWRSIAAVADLVRQVYVPAPAVVARGNGAATLMRARMRQAAADFTRIGIPPSRLGLMLGFHTTPGTGGRDLLTPTEAWLSVVRVQTSAARAVAAEQGLASVWSWGWGTWSPAEADPDKGAAACVYLSMRSPRLCDGFAVSMPEVRPWAPLSARTGGECFVAWRTPPLC